MIAEAVQECASIIVSQIMRVRFCAHTRIMGPGKWEKDCQKKLETEGIRGNHVDITYPLQDNSVARLVQSNH